MFARQSRAARTSDMRSTPSVVARLAVAVAVAVAVAESPSAVSVIRTPIFACYAARGTPRRTKPPPTRHRRHPRAATLRHRRGEAQARQEERSRAEQGGACAEDARLALLGVGLPQARARVAPDQERHASTRRSAVCVAQAHLVEVREGARPRVGSDAVRPNAQGQPPTVSILRESPPLGDELARRGASGPRARVARREERHRSPGGRRSGIALPGLVAVPEGRGPCVGDQGERARVGRRGVSVLRGPANIARPSAVGRRAEDCARMAPDQERHASTERRRRDLQPARRLAVRQGTEARLVRADLNSYAGKRGLPPVRLRIRAHALDPPRASRSVADERSSSAVVRVAPDEEPHAEAGRGRARELATGVVALRARAGPRLASPGPRSRARHWVSVLRGAARVGHEQPRGGRARRRERVASDEKPPRSTV
jgi:hypothetical protein